MRVEPYGLDSYLHVMKRGARGMPLTRHIDDRARFPRLLYYLNDENQIDQWERTVHGLAPFERPAAWPERLPLVKILAWVLMPNHFHLILKPLQEKGVAKFMQRLCGSMSMHYNAKYKDKGSLFQGSYKSRTINTDGHLQVLPAYVMVKNVFELYPGGLRRAVGEFDRAWNWALRYPFSSLPAYAAGAKSPIIDKDLLGERYPTAEEFYRQARELMELRAATAEEEYKILKALAFED